ncbi:MAG: PilZ domain-containing protein [Polyangiaceae bacterium]|nr:PilZ domain-containing protein [Polyangiaceae bacterium]
MAADHFRALARRPVSLPATLLAADGSWRTEVSVVDLGLGGAGLLVRGQRVAGTRVKLEVVSPSLWDPLLVEGTVCWTSAPDDRGTTRLGIAFDHHRAGRLRALLELIASAAYD